MKIKSLRIVGKNYRVLSVPSMDDFGQCDDELQELRIKPNLAPDLERDTLLHEAIHAIDYHMSLNMSEKQVSCVAAGVYALFNDNPEFWKYLGTKPKGESNGKNTSVAAKRGTKPQRRTQRKG